MGDASPLLSRASGPGTPRPRSRASAAPCSRSRSRGSPCTTRPRACRAPTTSRAFLSSATDAMRRASASEDGTRLHLGAHRYSPSRSIASATRSGTRNLYGRPAATRSRTSVDDTSIRGIVKVLTRPSPPTRLTTSRTPPAERRPLGNRKLRELEHARGLAPALEAQRLVGAQHEDVLVRPGATRAAARGVHREGLARPVDLDTRDGQPLDPVRGRLAQAQPLLGARVALDRTVRRRAHRHQHDPVQARAASTPPARTPCGRCAAG